MFCVKNYLVQIVEKGFKPTDNADIRLKKVALTLVPLIIGPAALLWGGIYIFLDHPISGAIPMFYAIISAFSLYYFFKTKQTLFLQNSQLTLVLLLPFLLMWSLGGFANGSMVMIWAIFSPIAALMFLDKRAALQWFVLYFMLVFISVLIDSYVSTVITPLPDLAKSTFYLLNLGFGSAGLYLLISYSFNQEKNANKADLNIADSAFEAQDALMITDVNGVILRVNKAFSKTMGYTSEEIVGQTPRVFKSNHHDNEFYRLMWESIMQTGSWQGEVWDRHKDGHVFPKWLTISAVRGDDENITHFVAAHLDITERKASEAKILELAFYDPLTELPNRQLLLDRMQHALLASARSGQLGAVIFIDLDNFKNLNDTLGHAMGDLLLQQVARRLISCVRKVDTVARLGGDEFVIILDALPSDSFEAAEQTKAIGEKILSSLNQPYQLNSNEFRCSCSIGVTLFCNEMENDVEELLKQADIAMYESKQAGRNTLRFFDHKMREVISARAALHVELGKAIVKQQLHLYYQVQVDGNRQPVGAEALIRWIHPQRGMVSPADFIPLAEETGLILNIGRWVLDTACAQLHIWSQDKQTEKLSLAVNISAKQFHQANFSSDVLVTVQQYEFNPQRLKLELTESLLLENTQEAVATMKVLKDVGIQLSLDDFGTGYSSLQYLKLLPLDQIKIDQSFVRDIATDPNDAAIVQTIIAMSKSLGLNVIAEGVETEAQREFLSLSGCAFYQGYLFGEPVAIEKLL